MQSSQPYPQVSIIVPVFNDAEPLAQCLAALEQQSYPKDRYQVIVVDNGSDHLSAVEALVGRCAQAVLAQESRPGSYAARNRGIEMAQGDAIAFTDADCIPAADWLEAGVRRLLETPNCGLVSGQIEIFPQDARCPTTTELFEMATAFPQEQHLRDMKYGATANLFTWKTVIQAVGSFNPTLKSGGDLDWGKRVYDAGYAQVYAPEVRIAHPARASLRQIRQKTVRLAGGHYDLLNRNLYHFFYEDSLFFKLAIQKRIPDPIKKNLIFALILGQDLIPPVNYVISVFNSPKLSRVSEKIRVAWVIVVVRYTGAWAKILLRMGRTPSRV
ncbi:glycosyltransferase [Romeria aff. gracilis LEGE 07310]|uniref:Glycosyltransferase n=1 Tax=Vasconcelosia minhoensis LEGE 07310 TaxID=915328 RepID=A0A8J7DCC1_9CYAN|nr:glycosyltransferase [Romeria gracilis]MBE9078742.1 glycosyltransferase [Romeria aff. gracilis LEGE 07310]